MRVILRKPDPVSLEDSHFKAMGDDFERFIGNNLEEKGEVVIYNGFIMGRLDNGVDLISISTLNKRINLIQCKNWKNTQIIQNDLIDIHLKLSRFYKEHLTTSYSFNTKILIVTQQNHMTRICLKS